MDAMNVPEGALQVVQKTFVSRAAVEAFFRYCRQEAEKANEARTRLPSNTVH